VPPCPGDRTGTTPRAHRAGPARLRRAGSRRCDPRGVLTVGSRAGRRGENDLHDESHDDSHDSSHDESHGVVQPCCAPLRPRHVRARHRARQPSAAGGRPDLPHGQGPASLTEQVLAHCRAAGASITVFAVGAWLADDPSLGRAIVRAGHDLGNHTWSHQQMPSLDATTAEREVARGAAALTRAVGSPGWWFRPSGTPRSTPTIRAAALASGYRRCVSYDVDPEDYRDPGAALVRSRTRRQVRPGSIVSLHLGHPGTVEALPGILSDLSSSGLRPVSLTTLLRD